MPAQAPLVVAGITVDAVNEAWAQGLEYLQHSTDNIIHQIRV
jgi:hypothetical protein